MFQKKEYRGSDRLDMGALPPKPPEFNALGESKGAEKKRTEAKASAPPSSPHLGAQVALQQCLVLQVGKLMITYKNQ